MVNDLIVVGRRQRYDKDKFYRIDVTSHNPVPESRESLSPFYLGPVTCYDGLTAQNVENAWQFSKVYPCHADENGNPTKEYFEWRDKGWLDREAYRHPMGKAIPLYSYWKNEDGNVLKLGYIEARKKIYVPLYAKAVLANPYGLNIIKGILENTSSVALADFDGYNNFELGMSYYDVLNTPKKKMGHAFVLAMMIEGYIYEKDGKIIVDEEKMKKDANEQMNLFS